MHKRLLSTFLGGPVIMALLLSGCAAGAPEPTGDGEPAAGPRAEPSSDEQTASENLPSRATASVNGREFSFELSTCVVYEEREVELSGPGGESGSDGPSYLDGGLMEMGLDARGEFRIKIGADGPFQSSDEFIALGAPTGGNFTVLPEGDGYLATGPIWDANGNDLGTGTLHFTCG